MRPPFVAPENPHEPMAKSFEECAPRCRLARPPHF